MTVKAKKVSLRTAGYGAGIAVLCLSSPLFLSSRPAAASDSPYLNWQAKAAPVQATDVPPPVQTPQVPVPPSPYGQVGDPYVHMLSWSTKPGAAQPRQTVATAAPARRAPVQQTATYATAPSEPVQTYQPRPNPSTRLTPQAYRTQPMASTLAEPAPDLTGQAPERPPVPMVAAQMPAPAIVRTRPPPSVTAQQTTPRPPIQAPRSAPAAQVPAPVTTAANDGAYQIPASSPYAARIAAARAEQARAQARAQAQAARPPQTAAPQTAPPQSPAPATVAAADDDKPFVPGQHYTDASDAPRIYSLHRAYGLKPDPITVDSHASGAVLDTSALDAAEAKAAKDEKADEDTAGDDPESDGVSAKTPQDTSSASATQNASASKTNKADQ